MTKIGRNQQCPCGSGKKYKHCHGAFPAPPSIRPMKLTKLFDLDAKPTSEAAEHLRIQQQGRGKQIQSFEHAGRRFVIAGEMIYYSSNWKTFIDFLSTYLVRKLGKQWFQSEDAKPPEERSPVLLWYHAVKAQEAARGATPKVVQHVNLSGAACCLFGLAYNLYLLDHNAELQERYLHRLRNTGNFQGAYYELIVANILIRAGFTLELEDETDSSTKHCEFSATSRKTDRKYWVEAKMRAVRAHLGKSACDGVPETERDATSRMTTHIREALAKPADGERLIFVDLNCTVVNTAKGEPDWMDRAVRRLDSRERDLAEGQSAYVFVTNIAFHRYLDGEALHRQALAYGLGMPDFSKPGARRILEMYRNKQKHIDGYDIMALLQTYPSLPSTFDGSLPSDTFGDVRSLKVGETYFFDQIDGGTFAKVTSGVVLEAEKLAYVMVTPAGGETIVVSYPLTDDQLTDYKNHPDVFFGEINRNGRTTDNPLDFFEWLLGNYLQRSKERILDEFAASPDINWLATLPRDKLAEIVCERRTISFMQTAAPQSLRDKPSMEED
ncbi:SEC-C domain-containing protein [Mesorhizobium sp. M1252]|uniref:YecA family protein n=1 Tax=Mesorhizobium sp. M1252 TaxID=2957073 RepID=UPI00333D34B6